MQLRTLAVSAVLLALVSGGGGAVAAGKITGKDVKNGSITGKDLKDASVTGADLEDGSVGGSDLQAGGVTGASVKDGSITGQDLAPGAAGLRGLQRVSAERPVTATNDYYLSTFSSVSCPTGTLAVAGGYDFPTSAVDVAVFRNRPSANLTAWEVGVRSTTSTFVGTFYALCATP